MTKNRQLDEDCVTCGERFHPKTTTARYCSDACRQKAYRDRNREDPRITQLRVDAASRGLEMHETHGSFALLGQGKVLEGASA